MCPVPSQKIDTKKLQKRNELQCFADLRKPTAFIPWFV